MKTAVITGGNSGIGKATALELAKRDYRIILHGRDPVKTDKAVEEIRSKTGNRQVEGLAVDISSIAAMKALSDAIRARTSSIQALVLSTGVILPNQVFTADGLEAGFVIQYLSRFALTQLLSAELHAGRAKIVMVGAPVIPGARIFFDDIALRNNFTMVRAMAQEMFANHLFVQEFARRNPANEVVMNMANVGIVNTAIVRHSNLLFKIALRIVGHTPEKAAGNFVFLADAEEVTFSGYFLKRPGRPDLREKINADSGTAERLWNLSMDLIRPVL